MNVALINSIGKNKWGGGEKWMIMAATGLKLLGHNVVVISRKDSVLSKRAKASDLPVKEIGTNSDFDIIACWKFCRFFKTFQPEVVIGCQNKDWRVASMALKMIGTSCKVYSRQGLQLLKNNWWYKWTVRHFSNGIITNTHTIKRFYDSFLPVDSDFIKVVFNGVETASESIEGFEYSKYIPQSEENPLIVLSTGRLAIQKGFKFLISAAAEIVRDHPNVYFFLAGQGKLEAEIRSRIAKLGIEKNFILLGFIEDIHPLLNSADIFVFSSLYEGMPNSILEAMAHGLPVVSTNVNGVSELIQDGVNGITIEPGNTTALKNGIEALVVSKEDRISYREHALEFVNKNFSVNKMIDELNSIILLD